MNFYTKEKLILRRKKCLWIFWVKEKLILWIYGSKGISFSTQEFGRKMIFPSYQRKLHDVMRNNMIFSSQKKKKNVKMIISLAWNTMLTGY